MISLFINELPTLTAFNDKDRVLVDSLYTVAAEVSTLRDYILTSRVVPDLSATNLTVTNLSALSSTFVTIDVVNYELSGFSVTGTISADEYKYGSQERPSFYGIKQALDSFLYVFPALTATQINGQDSAVFEVGTTLSNAQKTITYDSNKVEKVAITNYSVVRPAGRGTVNRGTATSYVEAGSVDCGTMNNSIFQVVSTWTVNATDWKGNVGSRSCNVIFRYKVYYGAYAGNINDLQTSSVILNNDQFEEFSVNREALGVRTVDAGSGKYIYVAYPAVYGTISQMRLNGLENSAITRVGNSAINFTNASGGTGLYNVYIFNNVLFGNNTVELY